MPGSVLGAGEGVERDKQDLCSPGTDALARTETDNENVRVGALMGYLIAAVSGQ